MTGPNPTEQTRHPARAAAVRRRVHAEVMVLRWAVPLGVALVLLAAWTATASENGGPVATVTGVNADRTEPTDGSGDTAAIASLLLPEREVTIPPLPIPAPGPSPSRFDVEALRDTSPGVPRPMARHGDLVLHAPTAGALVVGFHEAASRDGLALTPVGRLVENRNPTRVEAPEDDLGGVAYLILHSRGRIAPATSAIDVVMRDDDPVIAPVSGVVTDVRSFYLSGRHLDHRVEIRPDAADDLRVVVIHVDEVTVTVGDRVEGARTVIAGTARRFPFFSQIDAETAPERWPHVHVEVQRAGARRPGDG